MAEVLASLVTTRPREGSLALPGGSVMKVRHRYHSGVMNIEFAGTRRDSSAGICTPALNLGTRATVKVGF